MDNVKAWYNFRTGEYDYIGTPTDYSDYVPQMGGRGMYQCYVALGMDPKEAALKVLDVACGTKSEGSMTIRDKLIAMMVDRGLFESYANKVLDKYVDSKALSEVLHKPWADYLQQFHVAAWLVVSQAVIDWMNAEMPNHFARPMFDVRVEA